MPTKKQLIISAFENLDAEMLEILLNDGQTYQDVPKDVFVEELKRYFSEVKNFEDTPFDFKAYKGVCNKCNKEKKGFSFINSSNECMMSLVFEENEEGFTDIYKCGSFHTFEKEIENEWIGISFYEEDHVNYLPSSKNLQDEKWANRAVKEIEENIKKEGVLFAEFCINWYYENKKLDDLSEIFEGKFYRYKKKVKSYINQLRFIVKMLENEKLAKKYWQEFIGFPVVTEKSIKDWLTRCNHDFHYFIYGFPFHSNFKLRYFEEQNLKFDLESVYYIQNLSEILNKYFDWIPIPNPITEKEQENITFEKDSDYPF